MMVTQPIFTELKPPIFWKHIPANWCYLYIFYIKSYPRGLRNVQNNCELSFTSLCTVWPLMYQFSGTSIARRYYVYFWFGQEIRPSRVEINICPYVK
jgi:hypothetical protein